VFVWRDGLKRCDQRLVFGFSLYSVDLFDGRIASNIPRVASNIPMANGHVCVCDPCPVGVRA
jgi:hypothetical protein